MMNAWVNTLGQGGILEKAHTWQFREPAGTALGRESDAIYMGIFWISVVAFVVLMVLMVWFAWAYRRRPGVVPPRSPSHNTPLELFWTIVPSITLVWMFFAGFWGFAKAIVAPAGSEELFLEASQWQWRVTYPNGAISGSLQTSVSVAADQTYAVSRKPDAPHKHLGSKEAPIIVVPVGRPVLMRMISNDVLHAFWIPDFRGKLDVMPNRYTNYWFEADENQIGDHWVFCAEYCGKEHSEMLAVLRVLPEDQYQAVIKGWATPSSPLEAGRLWWRNYCSSCHTIDGKPGTGPTWKNLFGYEQTYTDGSKGVVDEQHVRTSVIYPSAKVRAGFKNEMQTFAGKLSESQINQIILFMRTHSDRGGSPAEEPKPDGGGAPPAAGGAGGG